MFRGLLPMALKETRQLLRDRATLRMILMLPVLQLVILGYAISTDVTNVSAVVTDLSLNESSREMVQMLENTGVFRLRASQLSYDDAYQAIVDGHAKVAFLIPPGFSPDAASEYSRTMQVLVDGSDSTTANYVMSTVANTARMLSARFLLQSGRIQPQMPSVEAKTRILFNPRLSSSNFFVPGLLVLILYMPLVLLTALSVVRERVEGTLEQLIVTPISRLGLILGKLLPMFALGAIGGIGVIVVMVYVFEVPLRGSLALLTVMMLIWVFGSLAQGLMVSSFAQTQLQAVMISILSIVPQIMLSGFMFPRESMPAIIYPITYLLPMTYALIVVRGIVIRGSDYFVLLPEITAMVVYAFGLIILAALRFRKRLG